MSKDIHYNLDARRGLAAGVRKLSDAVKTTLGPQGRYVALESPKKPSGRRPAPGITNDGVTVAKDIDLVNAVEHMGAKLVREAAGQTDKSAGDGTTTATVLVDAIVSEGVNAIASGANPISLRRGIEKATEAALEAIKSNAVQVTTTEQIAAIGTISANDAFIGSKIAEVMDKVGKDGVIIVEKSDKIGVTSEIVDGMIFERGFISPHMADDFGNQTGELVNPYILITEYRFLTAQEIIPILDAVSKAGRPLLLITDDLRREALNTVLFNRQRGIINCVAVQCPSLGELRKKMNQDLAIYTGAEVITEDFGLQLSDFKMDMLGTAEMVKITKDTCLIVKGGGSKEAVDARCSQLRHELERETRNNEITWLRERLGRLSGGFGRLKLGAGSESALISLRRRVEDALQATRSAVQEGIVAGGGVALVQAISALDNVQCDNRDEEIGVNVMRKAMAVPMYAIADNAGYDAALVVEKCKEMPVGHGLNSENGEYGDMIAMDVIDPVKVTRTALQSAVSVACLMLITEATITESRDINWFPSYKGRLEKYTGAVPRR